MPDSSVALVQPLLQEAAFCNACCCQKGPRLLSLFISLGFALLLSLLAGARGRSKQRVAVQDPAISMASALPGNQLAQVWGGVLGRSGFGWPSLAGQSGERGIAQGWGGGLRQTSAEDRPTWGWRDLTGRNGMGRRQSRVSTGVPGASSVVSGSPLENDHDSRLVHLPRLITSTALMKEGTERFVMHAGKAGFQGFDTAPNYDEAGVGAGLLSLMESGVARASVFVQTRVNLSHAAELYPGVPIEQQVEKSIHNSLSKLGLQYVDSLLLHSPSSDFDHVKTMKAWRAMEDAVRSNFAKQIGLTNVGTLSRLRRIYADATVKPAFVQQLLMPETGFENEMRAWCEETQIPFQSSWTVTANRALIESEMLDELAEKYDTTPQAVFLRFLMGQGILPVIDVTRDEHMKEDVSAWRLPLNEQDVAKIDDLLKQAATCSEETKELLANKKEFAESEGKADDACQNIKCKCVECTCGAACTCNISPDVTCDPCVEFKQAMMQKAMMQKAMESGKAEVNIGGGDTTRRTVLGGLSLATASAGSAPQPSALAFVPVGRNTPLRGYANVAAEARFKLRMREGRPLTKIEERAIGGLIGPAITQREFEECCDFDQNRLRDELIKRADIASGRIREDVGEKPTAKEDFVIGRRRQP